MADEPPAGILDLAVAHREITQAHCAVRLEVPA
jgi:hypothetical protein